MKGKHVVHVVYSLDIGGLERVLVNCINGLPEYYRHSVIVLTEYSSEFAKLIDRPVKLISLHKNPGHSWSIYLDIFKHLIRLKPDVLHTYNFATLEYQALGWMARVPVRIHAEHGRDLSDPEGSNKKYHLLRRLASPFLHCFVAVSDDLYRWLQGVVGLPSNKCRLVYNGVDTDRFSPRPESLQEDRSGKLVFGCVGRLQGVKNHKGLIKAFVLACEKNEKFSQEAELVLVGDGPLREELEEQAKQHSCRATIKFTGARHDMPEVYRMFELFVMFSFAEGVPMTILEAMATGLPVLSTDVGGIGEVVDASNSMLVPNNDVEGMACNMLYLWENRRSLSSMAASSRELVIRSFSEMAMLEQYQMLYEGAD